MFRGSHKFYVGKKIKQNLKVLMYQHHLHRSQHDFNFIGGSQTRVYILVIIMLKK